jgi:ABC-type transport system involved in multi-copper enzyme maturation permease subunit
LPSIVGVLAALYTAAAGERARTELESGELYSATSASAFVLLAAALRAGLPLLALLCAGAASQMLAADIGRGTHRLLLTAPIGRRAIVCGKLAAVALFLAAGALLLCVSSLLVATWKADFGDVVEILPNGKVFPLVAQAEIWPALLASLPSLGLAACALASLGFLASACSSSAASALAVALGAFALLDLARAPARAAGLEAWLPTTYLPSPLGDRSLLAGFADLAEGVSNPATGYLATAELVPLAWCVVALVLSLVIWVRRSYP